MARPTRLGALLLKALRNDANASATNPLDIQDASGNRLFGIDSSGRPLGGATSYGTLQYAEVSIAAAAIATLRATPVTLVAAPGAGKVLEFVSAVLILDYTAPGFTETADNLGVRYTDGSGTQMSETIEMTGFIDQTADTMTTARAKVDGIAAKTACENKALVLHNLGDGEFGGSGGSALRVKVAYRVHPTGW